MQFCSSSNNQSLSDDETNYVVSQSQKAPAVWKILLTLLELPVAKAWNLSGVGKLFQICPGYTCINHLSWDSGDQPLFFFFYLPTLSTLVPKQVHKSTRTSLEYLL